MIPENIKDYVEDTVHHLNEYVFGPIYQALKADPSHRRHLNPAFPFPRVLRIGILKGFVAIEYVGPEIEEQDTIKVEVMFAPKKSPFDFLGLDESFQESSISIPPFGHIFNTAVFEGESISRICDYFYDFHEMPVEAHVFGHFDFNAVTELLLVSNMTFFWTERSGSLRVRHVNYMELIPLKPGHLPFRVTDAGGKMARFILNLKVPFYDIELHGILNKFIELVNQDVSELEITNYIEQHTEILGLVFGCHRIEPQVELKWQFQTERPNLQPDFMIEGMDGFFDIIDFKLPRLNSKPIVGSANREHPSFEVDSAIAQVTAYQSWCEQEVNRRWLEAEKKIKVKNPKTILIMGHKHQFSAESRQELQKSRNTRIVTFDEVIEMARYQLYRVR
ncbi:MAG: Shedu anti-phage system protein SduA domain-containing protein [Prosthecobacter sp.]|uniref:Shedu anti-phage system protein SduA domain-containing protein n=1 Tax=Prosthecobacter sp. TaxID=1965333 RepID=UPI003BAFA485